VAREATVLLTGFEPFGGDAVNPSGDAVRSVAASWTGPERLVTAIRPVTFAGAAATLADLLAEHDPHLVIATGLAGGRRAIGIERVAVNLADARIPDNDGAQPIDEPSAPGEDAAAFASLPVKAIARAVSAAGIPCEVSLSAGTFVCNHVFFHAAAWAARHGRRAGFVHVPWATGQAPRGEFELPAEDITRAVQIAVRTTVSTARDDVVVGGALH
jgi:pyroglutamyl-peptidase